MSYMVQRTEDDLNSLRHWLDVVEQGNGQVISVTWAPSRASEDGDTITAGYVIVSEYV
jgi:hypothetical protein